MRQPVGFMGAGGEGGEGKEAPISLAFFSPPPPPSPHEGYVVSVEANPYLESPSDPWKMGAGPLILGKDQPFVTGHGDSR